MSHADAHPRRWDRSAGDPAAPPTPSIQEPPALASFAAWTALFSVIVNRGLLRSLGEGVSRTEQLQLRRLTALPQNLATILALSALALAIHQLVGPPASREFFGRPGPGTTAGRIGISSFAGIFLASVIVALFRPSSEMSSGAVLFTVISGFTLAILVGLGTLRLPASGSVRLVLGIVTLAAFAAFSDLILSTIGWILRSQATTRVADRLRQVGELAYLALPFAMWRATSRPGHGVGGPRRWTLAFGCVVGLGWALLLWMRAIGGEFGNVFYGATHLALFVERAPLVYALPMGLGLALGFESVGSTRDRQAGAGLLCLLAAGVAPRSVEQALYLALGLVLVSRWAVARATPDPAAHSPRNHS